MLVRVADGSVTALDPATGTTQWSMDLGARPLIGLDFAPVVVGDTVYLTDWSATVHALDLATGVHRRRHDRRVR